MEQASSQKKPVTASMVRMMKAPIRAISKALDLYVKGVTNFATTYNRPLRTMEPTPTSQHLPRSFTTSRLSDYDQPVEGALVRSISTAATTTRSANMEFSMLQHHCHQLQSGSFKKDVPRSCSVGMGRIDEDRVSSFRDETNVIKSKIAIEDDDSMFSKSRSHDHVSIGRSRFM